MRLFIKNDKEDLIGEVKVECVEKELLIEADKLVIVGFTREDKVMRGSIAGDRLKIVGMNEDCSKKIYGFSKYLMERKKAGLIKHDNHDLFILPPELQVLDFLECIYVKIKESSSTSNSIERHSTVLASANKLSTTSATEHKSSTQNQPRTNNFLSSLLTKIEASEKTRVAATKIKNTAVSNIYERVEQHIDTLKSNPAMNVVALEPMPKDLRALVHDIVSEFPEYQSCSSGDAEARHILIFRKGYIPEGIDPINIKNSGVSRTDLVAKISGTTVSRNKLHTVNKSSKNDDIGVDASIAQSLVAVDQVKRDRRTTEMVQEEMKKRKLQESDNNNINTSDSNNSNGHHYNDNSNSSYKRPNNNNADSIQQS